MKVLAFEGNGGNVHCNGDITSNSSSNSEEENGCHVKEPKKETVEISKTSKKRKRQEDHSSQNILEAAKRIKEEHLYIKTEDGIPQMLDLKKMGSSTPGTVIKIEKNETFDNLNTSDKLNHVHENVDKNNTFEEKSTKIIDSSPEKKTEKTQSKITSFFSSPVRRSHIKPKTEQLDELVPPYSDHYICSNCPYYKILAKEELRTHSKIFHKRIDKLSSFNRCQVVLKEQKIYNSDEIDFKQNKITPKYTTKSPSKINRKSTSNRKWNDKTPAAKVLKTLTKEPQELINCTQDVMKRSNLTKKKVIPEMLIAFVLFVRERHLIWERRHSKVYSKNWTQNKILKEHWFTNIYRELDRGTAFLKRNLHETVFRSRKLEPLTGNNHIKILKRILLKCFSYRLVNRLDTFLEFGKLPDVGDYEEWVTFLRYKYQLEGQESIIFTRAHQNNGLERYFKTMEFVKANLTSMAKELQDAAKERSLEKCFYIIKEVPGVGKFMSWQILCDLLELRQLGDCTDNQWTCLGPGARNGLRRIFKEDLKDELSLTRLLRNLCQASGELSAYEAMELDPPLLLGKEVSLKNIEHALCEFDKYVRFAMGQGVRQRRFNSTTSSSHYDKIAQKCPECCNKISIEKETAKPKFLKEKNCPLCKRLYHNGCTSKRHQNAMVELLGTEQSVWICPSCLPMVDCWQKEDYYYEEHSCKSNRSPKKKNAGSIKKFIKKKPENCILQKDEILSFEFGTEKHIDTITLSDSDESQEKEISILHKNKKQTKLKKHNKRITGNSSNKEIRNISDEEGREEEKENIANELNGDGDDDIEYLDEKERILRDQMRSLPLF